MAYAYLRSATGVQVDLILHTPYQEIWAIEINRSSIPKLSRGFTEACEDTQATHKWVITAEQGTYLHIPDQTDPLFRAKLTPLILDVNSTMKRTRAKLFGFS